MNLRRIWLSGANLRAWLVALTMSLLVVAAGCDDDDNTGTGPGNGVTQYQDFTLNLSDLSPVANQELQYWVINTDNNEIVAVGVIDSIVTLDTNITMPNALVEDHNYRIDVWVDVNNNGEYDGATVDNSWSIAVPETGEVDLTTSTTPTEIEAEYNAPGEDLTLNLTGFTPHTGQAMEFRVIEVATNRTVGVYRTEAVVAPDFTVTIPDVIENGANYQLDFFADFNMNGMYDTPPTDHAWRLTGVGGTSGLTLDFTHNTAFTDVGF